MNFLFHFIFPAAVEVIPRFCELACWKGNIRLEFVRAANQIRSSTPHSIRNRSITNNLLFELIGEMASSVLTTSSQFDVNGCRCRWTVCGCGYAISLDSETKAYISLPCGVVRATRSQWARAHTLWDELGTFSTFNKSFSIYESYKATCMIKHIVWFVWLKNEEEIILFRFRRGFGGTPRGNYSHFFLIWLFFCCFSFLVCFLWCVIFLRADRARVELSVEGF